MISVFRSGRVPQPRVIDPTWSQTHVRVHRQFRSAASEANQLRRADEGGGIWPGRTLRERFAMPTW